VVQVLVSVRQVVLSSFQFCVNFCWGLKCNDVIKLLNVVAVSA
jgi:hypothetical protein